MRSSLLASGSASPRRAARAAKNKRVMERTSPDHKGCAAARLGEARFVFRGADIARPNDGDRDGGTTCATKLQLALTGVQFLP